MKTLATGLLLAFAASPLAAQGGVAPPTKTDQWGWTALEAPLGRTWMRYQLLLERSTLPLTLTSGKAITALGLRRAALPGGAFAAAAIDVEISVYSTAQTAATLSQTFATNRAAGVGGVAFTRKTLQLPAADLGNPTDFVTIPFDVPHSFTGPNLLLEFVNRAAVAAGNGWLVDGVGRRDDGVATTFGASCGAHANQTSIASPGGLRPGADAVITLSAAPPNGAAALLIGLSAVGFAGIPLPFDTGFFMPSGCRLYVSIDATLTRGIDAGGSSQLTLRVPPDLALNNQVYYTQWLDVDAAATQLEFSAAQAIHVGPVSRVDCASTLRPNDDADSSGDPVVRDRTPVLRLHY